MKSKSVSIDTNLSDGINMLLGLWLGALLVFNRCCYANRLDSINLFVKSQGQRFRRFENFLSSFSDGLENTGSIDNCLIEASEIWEKTVKNEEQKGDNVEARDKETAAETGMVACDWMCYLRNVMFSLLQGLNIVAVRWLHAYLAFAVVVCSLVGLYFWSYLFVTFVFDGSELVGVEIVTF